jgi:DNA-binding CsgD family transcriptional regulator
MVGKIHNFFTLQTKNQTSTGNSALSKREIDVLKKVAKGLSNKEISDQLFISKNTVITHRKNITEKLGIKTISGLTVYALMNNLIDPGEITA